MTTKLLLPLGIIVLTISLFAVYSGFIKPMSEAYHFTQWQERNVEGRRALMQTRLDDAEREFGQALAEIRQSGNHRVLEAETLTMAGEVLRQKKNYAGAQNDFESAAKLLEHEIASEARAEENSNLQIKLSDALSRQAQVFDGQLKTTEALASRERVLTIYKNIANTRTIPGDDIALAEQMVRNYGKIAEAALSKGDYAQAREIYTKLFAMEKHNYVPEALWNNIRGDCKTLIKASPMDPDPLAEEMEKDQFMPFSSQ